MFDLYYSETCPYCRKVLDFLEKENIKFNPRDVSEPENLRKLLEKGGKAQVPFLVDNDHDFYSMIVSQKVHVQFPPLSQLLKKL